MQITKRQAKSLLGIETDAELARFFGIGRWAVGQWDESRPIPALRRWELRDRRPDLFDESGKPKPTKRKAA